MGKKRPGLGAVLKTIARGPQRSSLFYYLYDNHDEIARASAGRRIRWEPLVADFIDLALSDADGKPATAATARKTWGKVRDEVRKQRTYRATGILPVVARRQKKLPANWLPSGFAQPNTPPPSGDVRQGSHSTALPPAPHLRPAPSSGPETTQGSSRPAPGSAAAIREEMNLRSGLKANGEPKF